MFTLTIWLLCGGLALLGVFAIRHSRRCRALRCPHCCVRRSYYVGYPQQAATSEQDIGPVRCKTCQILFMLAE